MSDTVTTNHRDDAPDDIPEWLRISLTPSHIATVLGTLTEREHVRAHARSISKHKANPSRAHRIAHLPNALGVSSQHVEHYAITASVHPDNRAANRYSNVEAYDRTLVEVPDVVLPRGNDEGHSGSRYLNGNWVRELAGGKWWIATQAPLPNTAHAFLSVILQPVTRPPEHLHQWPATATKMTRVRTVVQLTRNVESGMEKAHVYFPPIEGQSWILSPEAGSTAPSIKVTLLKIKDIEEAHCVQSTVSVQPLLTEDFVPVVFQHLLYSSWPDFGIPSEEDRHGLLHFARLVDETNRNLSAEPLSLRGDLDPDPPVMVNCSAGIGRTGSFIALSSLFRTNGFLSPALSVAAGDSLPPLPPSPLGPLPNEIRHDQIAQEIDSLREQRPGMVQKEEQIMFLYEMLVDAFRTFR